MAQKIVKIYDVNCDVCQRMAEFDAQLILDMASKPAYRTVPLGQILDPDNQDPEDTALAHYAEVHAVNPDYTIDLPVYMVLSGKTYLGHVVGEQTGNDLREKLEKILNDTQNQRSKDHLYN